MSVPASSSFFDGLGNLTRAQIRLEARKVGGIGTPEMTDADEGARPPDLAVRHRLTVEDRPFLAIADVDDRGDALIEIQFAVEPGIIGLRVPQSGQHKFPAGIDHLRSGGDLHLPGGSRGGDAIALDDHDGVGHRRTAIAVDQRSALDHQTGVRLRVRGWRHARHGKRQRRGQRGPENPFSHEFLPVTDARERPPALGRSFRAR
jgi:hypothetical protein